MADVHYHRMMAPLKFDQAVSQRRLAHFEFRIGRPNMARAELRRAIRAWQSFRYHKQAAEKLQ